MARRYHRDKIGRFASKGGGGGASMTRSTVGRKAQSQRSATIGLSQSGGQKAMRKSVQNSSSEKTSRTLRRSEMQRKNLGGRHGRYAGKVDTVRRPGGSKRYVNKDVVSQPAGSGSGQDKKQIRKTATALTRTRPASPYGAASSEKNARAAATTRSLNRNLNTHAGKHASKVAKNSAAGQKPKSRKPLKGEVTYASQRGWRKGGQGAMISTRKSVRNVADRHPETWDSYAPKPTAKMQRGSQRILNQNMGKEFSRPPKPAKPRRPATSGSLSKSPLTAQPSKAVRRDRELTRTMRELDRADAKINAAARTGKKRRRTSSSTDHDKWKNSWGMGAG